MEICDKFLCVNRKNKECHVPKNVVAFTCKHTNAPCPKARCEYCDVKECEKQYDGRIDRMSMISEQTKELREIATNWNPNIPINPVSVVLNKAADTIESLSAKMADMERSAEDCGGGWIPCKERLPEEKINPVTDDFYEYEVTFKQGDVIDIRHYKFGRGHWWNYGMLSDDCVIAWREHLEPYHEP